MSVRGERQAGWWRSSRGATLVEYALAVSLLVVVTVAAITRLQASESSKISARGANIGNPDGIVTVTTSSVTTTSTPGGSTTTTTPPSGVGHVGALTAVPAANHKSVTVTVTFQDASGAALPNAAITGTWTVNGVLDATAGGCTTAANGQCSLTRVNLNNNDQVVFTVTSVSPNTITWDQSANNPNPPSVSVTT